jgi:hypothetical protein
MRVEFLGWDPSKVLRFHEIVLIYLASEEALHISEVVLVSERRRWAKAISTLLEL